MDGAVADIAAVTASQYLRLGGAAGVAAVLDDAVDRHAANPTLAPRLRRLDLPQLKALGVSFLSARAGGPHHDAAPQHARLSFSPAKLQAVVSDYLDTLAEHGVGAAEIDEVVGLFHTLDPAWTEAPSHALSQAPTGQQPDRAATASGKIEERGLPSLHIRRSDVGPAQPPRRSTKKPRPPPPSASASGDARASRASLPT